MSSDPTTNQKVRDNMYPHLTYDKLPPRRKLIANKDFLYLKPIHALILKHTFTSTFIKTLKLVKNVL
jgi:hypothetical protein